MKKNFPGTGGALFRKAWLILLVYSAMAQAQLQVVSTTPVQSSILATANTTISIEFDRPPNPATLLPATIRIRGSLRGLYPFAVQGGGNANSVTLLPDRLFQPGEEIVVTLTSGIRGNDGSALQNPLRLTFRIRNSRGDILSASSSVLDFPLLPGDNQPARLAPGDYDEDGFSDVITINSSSNTLTFLRNMLPLTGVPELEAQQGYNTGITPVDVISSDFDNDSHLDVLTANFNSNTLDLYRGDGSGRFARETIGDPGNNPAGLTGADFNGDGWMDAAVALFADHQVAVYMNDGSGNLLRGTVLDCEESTFGVAAGDADGDGDPDLAAINNGQSSVSIFLNNGSSGWTALPAKPLVLRPVDLQWANVLGTTNGQPGDSRQELVVLSSNLTIIGKQVPGSSAVQSLVNIFRYSGGDMIDGGELVFPDNALSLDIANMDVLHETGQLDSDLDLLAGSYTGSSLSMLQNLDNSAWPVEWDRLGNAANPRDLRAVDMDQDGDNDLIFASHLDNRIGILLNGLSSNPIDPDTIINFGDVLVGDTASIAASFTPRNLLPQDISVRVNDENNFDTQPRFFSVNNGSRELLTHSFFPQDTLLYITTVALRSNLPGERTASFILLTGRGVIRRLFVEPRVLDFGTIPPGTSASLDLSVRNLGNGEVRINQLLSSLPEFSHPAGPDLIPAQGTRTYSITFSPGNEGDFSDTLFVLSNDPVFPAIPVLLLGSSREQADLIAGDLQAVPQQLFQGLSSAISGTVSNINGLVDTPFLVRLSVAGISIGDTTINGITPGSSFIFRRNHRFAESGEIPVTLSVDVNNVIAELDETNNVRTIIVNVLPGEVLVKPNPFTPNGDNSNDRAVFFLERFGLLQPELEIYDFSGRRIRTLTDVRNSTLIWDGRDTRGQDQLPGVYLYVLQDGSKRVARGQVVLAR